jgi:alpha-amylase/alpha-mannosidase (GH57 family)
MFNVTLLWHMHQPYYVNTLTKTAMMPWVRLHCVKGYLDMIDLVHRYPELRVNFNFTPVLVKQIIELKEKKVIDLWESWSRKAPELLTVEEKARILENFFKINWDNLIFPHPRYRQLLEIRGRNYDLTSLADSVKHFTDRDYRDLQTWYNLAWCGFSAEKRYPELKQFKQKGCDFTEEEKHRVLDIHHEILGSVLQIYREAQEQGQIEITTTPFFHPIMPLVYDTDIAKRSLPGRSMPERFSAPDDVRAHLKLAQEQHEKVFGRKARGLWPSEGSVCPEIMPLLQEAGIEYFCTDEGVLFRSLQEDPAWRGQMVDHLELFHAWDIHCQGAKLKSIYRERPLSDFIGFNAARNTAVGAADYLIHHLEHIAEISTHPHGALCLALDGENAWEAFPDGGEQFLSLFYERMLASLKFKTRRLGDYMDESNNLPVLTHLHSGSWINSDFDIWIGDAEENQAWEWVSKTREFLIKELATKSISQENKEQAWEEIYAAEGSDWFWWYGPDFQTDCDFLFDELFRTHLKNVYILLGVEPPKYLEIPICLGGSPLSAARPFSYIDPPIFEPTESYYDWLGAGVFDVKQQQTAMFQSDRVTQRIFYGFSQEKFFLRLDTNGKPPEKIVIEFHQPSASRICLDITKSEAWIECSKDGVHFERIEAKVEFSIHEHIKIAAPLNALGWKTMGEQASFMLQILENNLEKERYPERGLIEFQAPSPQFKLQNWFI